MRTASMAIGFGSNKPVYVGQTLDLVIEDISKHGDGVTHVERFVIFVKDADFNQLYKGKTVKARIVQVRARFGMAEVI